MFAGVVVAGVCSPLVFLWCPRVCSLGRWLASVCFGSVAAAGLVVACHGYALSGLGSCLGPTLPLSFSVCRSICFFGGIHGCLRAEHGELSMFVRYVWAFRTRVLKTRVPERAF